MLSCRSSSSRPLLRLILAAAIAGLATACSEPQFNLPASPSSSESTSSTSTTTETESTTGPWTFTGTLDVGGRRFYSFVVPSERTAHITLEGLQAGDGSPSAATVVLGLGVPSGTGCAMLREVAAVPSASPHIDELLSAGVYCAQLADPGTLRGAVGFSVLIELP